MRPFLDTNILVYAVSNDPRQRRAQELLAAGGTISVQVLNEFTNVLLNKLRRGWPEIEAALEDVCAVLAPAAPLTVVTHQAARKLGISPRTIRKHLEGVFAKAKVPSRAAAVAWWLRQGHP